jgi:uncharacterized protein YdhG (YjbR/CyaY superfamily)
VFTASVIEASKDELKGFSTSKGTNHFPTNKPMPVELIKRLVQDPSCAEWEAEAALTGLSSKTRSIVDA